MVSQGFISNICSPGESFVGQKEVGDWEGIIPQNSSSQLEMLDYQSQHLKGSGRKIDMSQGRPRLLYVLQANLKE